VTTLKIHNLTYIATKKPPPKLAKAMAVITTIHDEYAKQPWVKHKDISKESCVLCSLTIRDFLQRIGFKDARVRSVTLIIKAKRGDEELHSLGIGTPHDRRVMPGKWAGHLVTTVDGFLIDATLAPSKRPQWPDLSEIAVLEMFEEPTGHRPPLPPGQMWPVAGAHLDADDGSLIEMVYLDRPENQSWKTGNGGGGSDVDKSRRRAVTDALVRRFGSWRGS
jgi:hypothetical protein